MGKIGLQLYSVRDKTNTDFLGTIRQVGEMGYDGVQFAGFFDTPAVEVKKVMDEVHLVAAGSHMGMNTLADGELAKTLEYNREIGNDLIICPSLPGELQGSADAFKRAAEALNQIGLACQKEGFTFGYHNHSFEFKDLGNGQTGFEILFGETEPELVKMELDCFWASHGGYAPEEIIQKYQNRVISLHIKDMKHVDGKKISTEVGNGELDIKGLLQLGDQYNVRWFTVEQENFERDTLESAMINIKNIKSF